MRRFEGKPLLSFIAASLKLHELFQNHNQSYHFKTCLASEIIIKNVPVFLQRNNVTFAVKFSSPPESIPVKYLNKMLPPKNLVKPVTLRLHLFIMAKVSERCRRGRAYPKKEFLFIPFNLSNRHWTLLFFNLKQKHCPYWTGQNNMRMQILQIKLRSSQILFLRTHLVTQEYLQLEVCRIFYKTMLLLVVYFHVTMHRRKLIVHVLFLLNPQ